jgi:hypothetical protein
VKSTICAYDKRIEQCLDNTHGSEYECVRDAKTVWKLDICSQGAGPYIREELEEVNRFSVGEGTPQVEAINVRSSCKFKCKEKFNGTIMQIPYSWKNDGPMDCEDGSDEE